LIRTDVGEKNDEEEKNAFLGIKMLTYWQKMNLKKTFCQWKPQIRYGRQKQPQNEIELTVIKNGKNRATIESTIRLWKKILEQT